jgi:ubiquitin carboxyl-terminal hydrolase 9/24
MLSSAQAGRQSQIPVGLLRAANVLYELQLRDRRYSQQYQYSAYGRYLGVIRSLIVVRAVENWMMDAVNREHWKPFEHDLREEDPARSHHHQVRNDMTRREVVNPAVPYETSTGDSMQDESEDDDSRDPDPLDNRKAVYLVEGAGLEVLNGKYEQMVDFEGAYQFQKEVTIEGRKEVARLFRCSVNNNTKHWFISIVPDKIQPGTNKDRDFYSAPAPNASRYPPTDGWVKQLEGREPAPRVSRVEQDADGDRPMWDDGVDGGPQQYHI